MLWLAMAFIAIMIVVSSNAFGDATLGDRISIESAVGFALWAGFIAMFFGGLALALAPFLGRSGSAGAGTKLAHSAGETPNRYRASQPWRR